VHREIAQSRERGVAAAEVVDREREAASASCASVERCRRSSLMIALSVSSAQKRSGSSP